MNTGTWIMAARLRTLPAAGAPVLVGCALAISDGGFHPVSAAAALLGALFIQVGTNFANDYFDFVNGADTDERVGPTRATQAGLIPPKTMKMAFILAFSMVVPIGIYLTVRGGWPMAVVGILSIAAGILYTGGPRPLGYMGLGDVFVLVFFGPVAVAGTHYIQTLTLSPIAIIAGLAPGLLSTAILVVNNLRDIETDRATGKHTLAVRLGPTAARIEYTLAVILGALGVPLVLVTMTGEHLLALGSAIVLLPALPILKSMWRDHGRALDPNLGKTGAVMMIHSILFSVGWLL